MTFVVNGQRVSQLPPLGCWNKPRLPMVAHSQNPNVQWPDVFMDGCQWRKTHWDKRCEGCIK